MLYFRSLRCSLSVMNTLGEKRNGFLGTEAQLFHSRYGNAESRKRQKSWFLTCIVKPLEYKYIDKQPIIVFLQMKRQFKNRNDLNLLQYPKLVLYE